MLIDSVVALKRPLIALFRNEFREHESPNTPTALESLELTEDDFLGLQDIQHILSPFKEAQKALEGENYVSLSFLPLAIEEIGTKLINIQGAIDPEDQAD